MKSDRFYTYACILGTLVIVLMSITVLSHNNIDHAANLSAAAADITPAPDPRLSAVENRENSSDYTFINPLLFIETRQESFPEYVQYDELMAGYIRSVTPRGSLVNSVSVYFRDMNQGHWTGINEEEKYEPSSLLKVAVMIAAYRDAVAQSDQSAYSLDSYLKQKLYYPGPDTSGQYYVFPSQLAAGTYTYKELIDDMIINSDNVALGVILNKNQTEFNKVYKDFRLPAPVDNGGSDYMTAKSYSVVFRTLFNSTYLPWDVSERLLGLLASTTFMQGIMAGLPQGTLVAHKFGEHTNLAPNGSLVNRELHDCGIVYYPKNPYLLCIMTKGAEFPALEKVISEISRRTYDYVDTRQKTKK